MGLPGVRPPGGLLKRLQWFDSIVTWYGSNREEFRTQMSQLGVPIQFFDALPPAGEKIHAADFFLKQAGCSGVAIPRIPCRPAPPGDFAVIHPFSGSARKNWPLERYRELARRLEMSVRWCAGPEEQLDDAVRIDNLHELASWFSTARLYIGNDSGITHLAAATGVPVVAIFGPTDPAVWAPRGERVRVVSGNLDDISVAHILSAVDSITT
jgi:heptosyltransferase-3